MSNDNGAVIKFINGQAVIVTLIFGLFGGALTKFLGIAELSLRYMSIASLLGLVLILLINLLLKVSKKASVKLILKLIAILLFVGLIISFFRFDRIFGDATFEYTDIDSVKSNFIKGTDKGLQRSASEFLVRFVNDNGRIPPDQELLDNAGGIYEKAGINNITKVISGDFKVNMRSITVDSEDGIFKGELMVFVNDTEHLDNLINKLKMVNGIISAHRFDTNSII